jgi:hypothetical protein
MAEQGKKPEGNLEGINVFLGMKNAPTTEGEVEGHMSPGAFYACWAGDCADFVPFGWNYYYCSCNLHLNRV